MLATSSGLARTLIWWLLSNSYSNERIRPSDWLGVRGTSGVCPQSPHRLPATFERTKRVQPVRGGHQRSREKSANLHNRRGVVEIRETTAKRHGQLHGSFDPCTDAQLSLSSQGKCIKYPCLPPVGPSLFSFFKPVFHHRPSTPSLDNHCFYSNPTVPSVRLTDKTNFLHTLSRRINQTNKKTLRCNSHSLPSLPSRH